MLETPLWSHPGGHGIWTQGQLPSEDWACQVCYSVSWVALAYCKITGTHFGLPKCRTDISHWFSRQTRCRELTGNFLLCFLYLPEPMDQLENLLENQSPRYCHKLPELEYPGVELIICLGLVISLRTCYYDKHIHVSDSLKKSSNDIPQISKC